MAAYAGLVSLLNTMAQIQIHPRLSTCFDKEQIESLGETVGLLLNFIESYNGGVRTKQVQDLEAQIAFAARAAEDTIESHIVDLIRAGSTKIIGGLLHKMMRCIREKPVIFDMQKVTEDLDSIRKDVAEVEKQGRFEHQTPHAASSSPVSAGKTTIMVGFDDYLIHLLDKLTDQQSHRVVIPIIGMGGVGKTTLARNAFDNLLIKQHFDVRAWTTISQNYSVREILLQILSSIKGIEEFMDLDEHQLGEQLHKCLFNRRYLVILDDMWGIDVWDEINFFFPDNSNGSRIVVTSRLHDISHHFNSPYLAINLLDENKSWNLFCQESFGEEGCPAELEEVGKKICENCKGLPLSIVVIGGFLRKSNKTLEYCEGVARDMYSILSSKEENQVMSILFLSYNHLSAHLKPCFLYMGIFAEDEEIIVSRLVKLWVAEGLLRPNNGQSLEEVGEWYLKDLVDRNLVLANRWGSTGKIRACNIHDFTRELCLSVAKKERFICVTNLVGTPRAIDRKRCIFTAHERMSVQNSSAIFRTLLQRRFLEDYLWCLNLRFLDWKLTDVVPLRRHEDLSIHIPEKIYLLWNLQTVIIEEYGATFIAPSELWEMIQLRYLKIRDLCLPDPPARNDRVDLVLPNLQTLKLAKNFRLSEEVCKRITNIKKLGLVYSKLPQQSGADWYYCPQNLVRFHKLESLSLEFIAGNWRPIVLNMTFPSSLKKLSLYGGGLYWKDLEMNIGSLPNLEVLKLENGAMEGSEWNPVEGDFGRLRFLEIHYCRLCIWNAAHFHFPVLEKLVLLNVSKMDEIPLGIGEIPTLRTIRLIDCNISCSLSAVKILEEQESLENDDLQVEITFLSQRQQNIFWEMVEEEGGFTSKNLHVKNSNFS